MSKVTFYLAASYPRKQEAIELAGRLVDEGFVCTATWLTMSTEGYDETFPGPGIAKRDIQDIRQAEIFIGLIGDTLSHGGRDTELGVAIALNKPIFLLGNRQQVFHVLPCVTLVTSFGELLACLQAASDR